jgi:hypothetical protein
MLSLLLWSLLLFVLQPLGWSLPPFMDMPQLWLLTVMLRVLMARKGLVFALLALGVALGRNVV